MKLRPEWIEEWDKIIDERALNWSGFLEYWMDQERKVILEYPGDDSKAIVMTMKNKYGLTLFPKKIKELYESGELQKMVESGELKLYPLENGRLKKEE